MPLQNPDIASLIPDIHSVVGFNADVMRQYEKKDEKKKKGQNNNKLF